MGKQEGLLTQIFFFNLKEMIQLAKTRIELVKSLHNQLLLQKFSVHLDCLYLYLKARSIGITMGKRDDLDIDFQSEIVSTMAEWNIDWKPTLPDCGKIILVQCS